jgi:hypothetical protein
MEAVLPTMEGIDPRRQHHFQRGLRGIAAARGLRVLLYMKTPRTIARQGGLVTSIALAFAMGCSSEEPKKDASDDATVFEASEDSKSELGVDQWVGTSENGVNRIEGRTASGQKRVTITARKTGDDTEEHAEHVIQVGSEKAHFNATITRKEDGSQAFEIENTVSEASAKLRRSLELAAKDVNSPQTARGGGLVAKAVSTGLSPSTSLGGSDTKLNEKQCGLLKCQTQKFSCTVPLIGGDGCEKTISCVRSPCPDSCGDDYRKQHDDCSDNKSKCENNDECAGQNGSNPGDDKGPCGTCGSGSRCTNCWGRMTCLADGVLC